MLPGVVRLQWAGGVLRSEGDTALFRAASEVWSAMIDLPRWPSELRGKAVELQGDLLRYGPIRMTLDHKTPSERLELQARLLEFTEYAGTLDFKVSEPWEESETPSFELGPERVW